MKKILVVVDMQKDFVDGALGSREAVSIVDNVVKKIENFDGDIIASATYNITMPEIVFELEEKITGKHAVYFEFITEDDSLRAMFDGFRFEI